jgi:hypothetical protein
LIFSEAIGHLQTNKTEKAFIKVGGVKLNLWTFFFQDPTVQLARSSLVYGIYE